MNNAPYVRQILLFITVPALIAISIIIRFPKIDTYIFYNADATYHVLLTMEAYEETPVSIHKFLPIVSLGNPDDKGIKWGATIPDRYGNYYYTSFSPAGYLAPYFFIKIFRLPINEISLYIFNSILYTSCSLMSILLFIQLFDNVLSRYFIVIMSTLVYLFSPEIMHSQGIVYWHHSLFQLLFLCQLNLFLHLKNKYICVLFFVLCLIIPYVEWTGYVSNMGFAIAVFLNEGIVFKKDKVEIKTQSLCTLICIIILTVISFVIFVVHYLSVVSANDFCIALISRFFARNITAKMSFLSLFKGYIISYGIFSIIMPLILIVTLFRKNTRVLFFGYINMYKGICFISLFSLLENIIMKQHASTYSFDRIKAIVFIIFVLLCCVASIIKIYNRYFAQCILFVFFASAALINSMYYIHGNNNYYIVSVGGGGGGVVFFIT
jgi:hypothetical protein